MLVSLVALMPASGGNVSADGTCTTPPSGMVSWWRAEGDASDSVGSNAGSLQGSPTFASGEVGQAFNFNGSNQYVLIPNSASLQPQQLGSDAWVFPRGVGDANDSLGPVVFVKDTGSVPG